VSERSSRILLADRIAPEGIQLLEEADGIEVDDRAGITESELLSVVSGYEALIVRSRTHVTAEVLEAGTRLKVVGRAGVGVDNIDVETARQRGVVVLNAPGGNVISAAEFAFALMLALVRRIPQADASLRAGRWERSRFRGSELNGKTLGLIGAGRIGSEVAKRAQAFGMQVVVHDPCVSPERAREMGVELMTLAALLQSADVVSIHTPLNDETRGLIGSDQLKLMKPTAYLVNAARGGVVDEVALAAALEEKNLAGAALDVFEQEPVSADHPLLKLENVVAVAHLGAATHEAQMHSGIEICKAVRDALIVSGSRPAVSV